ncbi:MAG: lipid-A-disaccharide synthase [Deltaproteobacteria bacterium]|nr:lipid-A-disaccharide synthase [Deltaproteobacteria bacterium]
MIVAGEASGDIHGARLVEAIRELNPELDFFGIGSSALRQAGVDVKFENSQIAVVGISEALAKLKLLARALRVAKRSLIETRPALLILIDFPDFNLRLATVARKHGIPVMYYISPQVWAWRRRRVKKIKKVVDHMVVIFPFEVPFYKRWNIPVTFVGHPLLDSATSKTRSEKEENANEKELFIGLLPGSRNEEITRLLPAMIRAAEIISEQIPGVRFAIPVASRVEMGLVKRIVERVPVTVLIQADGVQDVLAKATLVITASGTVTLEAAIANVPMIIVYRISGLSYWLAKLLIRVKYIGLVNLIAGRMVVPELIQHEVSAENIARHALEMLEGEKTLAEIRSRLRQVVQQLGAPGASRRAAEVAMSLLSK